MQIRWRDVGNVSAARPSCSPIKGRRSEKKQDLASLRDGFPRCAMRIAVAPPLHIAVRITKPIARGGGIDVAITACWSESNARAYRGHHERYGADSAGGVFMDDVS